MKRLLVFTLFFFSLGLAAQGPQGMSYQGAVSNADGTSLANSSLALRLTIFNVENGQDVYAEEQVVQTDAYSTFEAIVGQGTPTFGIYEGIEWDGGDGFISLRVEVDLSNTGDYELLQESQLVTVPYALYSPTAFSGPIGPTGFVGANGPEGSEGASGPPGPTGPQGPNGSPGLSGSPGLNGPTGPTGPGNGPTGPTGPQGETGPPGPVGATGPTGPSSPTPPGVNCPDGPTGPVGYSPWGTNNNNASLDNKALVIQDDNNQCWSLFPSTDGTLVTTSVPCP